MQKTANSNIVGKAKKAEYKDRAPFNVNVEIEKKFKEGYKNCLQNIFVNLSHKITEFNKK